MGVIGAHIAQFCGAVDASTGPGGATCRKSDWRNDEPGDNPKDCAVDRGAGLCVPENGALPQSNGRQVGQRCTR